MRGEGTHLRYMYNSIFSIERILGAKRSTCVFEMLEIGSGWPYAPNMARGHSGSRRPFPAG